MSLPTLSNFAASRATPAAADVETLSVTSPRTGEAIALVPMSAASDVDAVVAAAHAAGPAWAALTLNARALQLTALHGVLTAHSAELIDLIEREHGKTRTEAAGDLAKGLETLAYATGVGALAQGHAAYVSSGVMCRDERAAVGVVASIVPFNFPFMVPFWTVPLALAMGNTCVVKPSEKVPLTMTRVAELAAGVLPPGVLNIVHGSRDTADLLIADHRVRAVTFVGSSPVAEAVHRRASALGKRVLALGGAKNHLVALPDCDLEMTARDVVASFTGCAGQRCMAAAVLLVVGEQPALLARIVELAAQLVPATDGAAAMGPVIDAAAVARIDAAVQAAVADDCAELLLDGSQSAAFVARRRESQGFWVAPSILLHRSSTDRAMHEEIFGPVLSVLKCVDAQAALAVENASAFGNAACVYTSSGAAAEFFAQRFGAAMIGVNVGVPVPREPFSFGGTKRSRFGAADITGDAAIEFFSIRRKYLVAFNRNLSGLLVFRVLTASASPHQLANTTAAAAAATAAAADGKSEFWHFFQLAWSQTFTAANESLHRDLCLVTADNRYIIAVRLRRVDLANASANSLGRTPPAPPNTLTCIKALEDITVLVIDIHSGRLVDSREYLSDIIYLSGHNGVSLYEDRLCLLSLKHQCLRILRIGADGRLTNLYDIGWNTREDDAAPEHALRQREINFEQAQLELRSNSLQKRGPAMLGACIDDAEVPRLVKRQKTGRVQSSATHEHGPALRQQRPTRRHAASAAFYASTALTPEAIDPGLPGSLVLSSSRRRRAMALRCPLAGWSLLPNRSSRVTDLATLSPSLYDMRGDSNCPDTAMRPRPSRVVAPDLTTGSGVPLPFIFAHSIEAQAVRNLDEDVASHLAATDRDAPTQSEQLPSDNSGGPGTLVGSLSPMMAITAERAAIMPFQTLQRLPPHYRLIFSRAMQPAGRLDALAESDISMIEPSLTTAPHSGLKQQLLGALFMRARAKDDCGLALQYFYRTYRQYEGLVLWRAQFVSLTCLLLRFVPLQVATSRSNAQRSATISSSTVTNSFTLLAEFDMVNARFGKIWDTADSEASDEVESRLDVYRAPMASSSNHGFMASALAPSLANDVYLRDSFESAQQAIRTARSGGPTQAARKASALLPFAPQCMQESPLLDPSQFKCNLRTRQTIEKYRPASTAPIRFYDRRTGVVKFVLSPFPVYMSSLPLSYDASVAEFQRHAQDHAGHDSPTLAHSSGMFGLTMRSGAVLLPSGGVEELNMLADSSAQLNTPPALAPSINPQAQQSSVSTSSQKSGAAYLFHPTLPLVLSTRSDMSITALPISNIHFWSG
ncbi:hypothetical protein EV174_001625 [Coemansia sp. RSA 2320]|nr:hypothetical protein EV174_001625 [Coemansia sp. RSA 2320]